MMNHHRSLILSCINLTEPLYNLLFQFDSKYTFLKLFIVQQSSNILNKENSIAIKNKYINLIKRVNIEFK